MASRFALFAGGTTWIAVIGLAIATGCRDEVAPPPRSDLVAPTATTLAAATTASTMASSDSAPPGDVARGHDLVAKFECTRCHDGTGLEAATQQKHCVHCHQDILAGKFSAPAALAAKWRDHLGYLREVPSLGSMGKRYRRDWIARFLQNPYDLRPRLPATMPRLAMNDAEARDLAAYLTRDAPVAPPSLSLDGASATKGRTLVEAKGCGSCHEMTGVPALPGATSLDPGERELRSAVALAPDLRFTRDRFRPAELVTWLLDPKAVKADTVMPLVPMTEDEAHDIASYLMTTELAPIVPKAIPPRLPPLARRVGFDEVMERVLHKTCRHCHSEPDYALGEGGPGNTGGFGFPPRGLNLGNYEGVLAGFLDDHKERHSVFSPMPDGTPRIIAALIARQEEEAGRPRADIRGMPLGLPALTSEEVQLVETWVSEGKPQ